MRKYMMLPLVAVSAMAISCGDAISVQTRPANVTEAHAAMPAGDLGVVSASGVIPHAPRPPPPPAR